MNDDIISADVTIKFKMQNVCYPEDLEGTNLRYLVEMMLKSSENMADYLDFENFEIVKVEET